MKSKNQKSQIDFIMESLRDMVDNLSPEELDALEDHIVNFCEQEDTDGNLFLRLLKNGR